MLRTQRQRLVPLEVAQRAPAERFVLRDRARRGRGSRRGVGRAASASWIRAIVNHATSCSGAPIDAMSQSSTASGARSSPKITLPKRTSPQSSTGSDSVAGSVRPAPVERVDERGQRRARRSTSRDSRPRSRAPPRCRVRERRPRPSRSARCVATTAPTNASCTCARSGSPSDSSHGSKRRDLADDVAAHPRHHDERRAEPLRVGHELRRRDRDTGRRGRALRDRLLPEVVVAERADRRRREPHDELVPCLAVVAGSDHARSTSTVSLDNPIDGCSALSTRTSRAPVRVRDPTRERSADDQRDHDVSAAPCRTSRVQLHS